MSEEKLLSCAAQLNLKPFMSSSVLKMNEMEQEVLFFFSVIYCDSNLSCKCCILQYSQVMSKIICICCNCHCASLGPGGPLVRVLLLETTVKFFESMNH